MDKEEWDFNTTALWLEIQKWKKNFIKRQKVKNQNILQKELIEKIKKEKSRKFKEKAMFIVNRCLVDTPNNDKEKEE